MFSQQREEKGLVKIRTLICFGSICLSLYKLLKQKKKIQTEEPRKFWMRCMSHAVRGPLKNFSVSTFTMLNPNALYRKSQDLNVDHRKYSSKESLIEVIKENHKKDHRKSEAIYDSLRTSVFPVVRINNGMLMVCT